MSPQAHITIPLENTPLILRGREGRGGEEGGGEVGGGRSDVRGGGREEEGDGRGGQESGNYIAKLRII